MSRIQIESVSLPGDVTTFVKSWWPIYADDPHWVPPLMMDQKSFFNPSDNPYFKRADIQCFMARKDGVVVGTIAATVDKALLEHEPGVGMFGFFEFIDDQDVSKALFSAAMDWLTDKGMEIARGPFNFSPNHEFGLLVDGFDTDPCIANPHNRAYYESHYQAIGMHVVKDWYAYWMDKGPCPPNIEKIAQRFLDRNPKVSIRTLNMKDYDNESKLFYEIYNDAWEDNWGHVKISEEEFFWMSKNLKLVLNPDLCFFAYLDDECVAASITLPDFNQVAKKMNGSIFPFGWWHFLFGKSKIDALRIFVLGVKKKYQRMALGAPLYLHTWKAGEKLPIRGAEASLILEDNFRMRGALEKLGARIYKTYRTFEMPLVEGVLTSAQKAEIEAQAKAEAEAQAKAEAEAEAQAKAEANAEGESAES